MSQTVGKNIWRFLLLVILQVLIFDRINIGGNQFNYIHILLYPLFLFLLPVNVSKAGIILLGFFLGMSIDMFANSPGLHASASVFTAFIRPTILGTFEPRGGYKVHSVPTAREFGNNWFFRYAGTLLALHLLFYFSVEAFQFSAFFTVLLKTTLSFVVSIILIVVYMLIFNPKE